MTQISARFIVGKFMIVGMVASMRSVMLTIFGFFLKFLPSYGLSESNCIVHIGNFTIGLLFDLFEQFSDIFYFVNQSLDVP